MDVHMPELDGVVATELIRKRCKAIDKVIKYCFFVCIFSNVFFVGWSSSIYHTLTQTPPPVVFVTADVTEATGERCRGLGCAVLRKPATPDEIAYQVLATLPGERRASVAAHSEEMSRQLQQEDNKLTKNKKAAKKRFQDATTSSSFVGMDPDAFTSPRNDGPLVYIVEDDPTTRLLMQHRVKQRGWRVKIFDDGSLALEALRECAQNEDTAEPIEWPALILRFVVYYYYYYYYYFSFFLTNLQFVSI